MIEEQVKELLKRHGFALHVNTPYCDAYLEEHKTCGPGCESYQGCSKGVRILHLFAIVAIFPPKTTKEAIETAEHVDKKVTEILRGDGG